MFPGVVKSACDYRRTNPALKALISDDFGESPETGSPSCALLPVMVGKSMCATAHKVLTARIRSGGIEGGAHMMTSRAHQEVPAWSTGSGLVTLLGRPPRDPDDDDDEDEEDEYEGEEEPAIVREPDE